MNRDQDVSLVPSGQPNRDRWHLGAGPKTLFLLVFSLKWNRGESPFSLKNPRRPVRRGFRAASEVCSVDLHRRPQSSSLGWCYILRLVVYIVGLVVYIFACISRLLRISDFRFTIVFDLPVALLWLHPRGFICYIYSCLVTFWHQRVHCCTDEFTVASRSCGRWYHYSALLFCRSYR
jgi:hypothetical protein